MSIISVVFTNIIFFTFLGGNGHLDIILFHALPLVCQFIEYFGMSNVAFNNRLLIGVHIPFTVFELLTYFIISRVDRPVYKFASFKGDHAILFPLSTLLTVIASYVVLGLLKRQILKAQGHLRILKIINGEPLDDTNETQLSH